MSIYCDANGVEHPGEGQGTFGIAVLSRFPIEEEAIIEFGVYDETSGRSARNALAILVVPAVWSGLSWNAGPTRCLQ
jgi:hypothetical protein